MVGEKMESKRTSQLSQFSDGHSNISFKQVGNDTDIYYQKEYPRTYIADIEIKQLNEYFLSCNGKPG